jgi:hypothetical protein
MSDSRDDLPEDWWTTDDVLAYLRLAGAPVTPATWRAYVAREQAPAPARRFGRSPVWTPASIRSWQAARARRGSVVDDAGTKSDS